MANFPAPTRYRIPWHRDETVVIHMDSDLVTPVKTLDQSQRTVLNDNEAGVISFNNGVSQRSACVMLFPRLLQLDGIYLNTGGQKPFSTWRWSSDTSDGVNGTWQALPNTYSTARYSDLHARLNIEDVDVAPVRGLRFEEDDGGSAGSDRRLAQINLYGTYDDPDQHHLEIWDPTNDQRADPAHLDLGDVRQSTQRDVQFRVKNVSPTLTASEIIVSMVVPNDSSPSFDTPHTFSDGGPFQPQINIGDLSPGQVSSIVTCRQDLPADAPLALQWGIVTAAPGTMAL